MRKWGLLLLLALVVVLLDGMPFEKTDVAKLRPVQVLYVSTSQNGVFLRTDTEDSGRGETLQEAMR